MSDSLPDAPVEPTSESAKAMLPFTEVTKVLGEPLRWAMLRELAEGKPLMVVELAGRVGKPAGLVSKHLAVLRQAGLVDIKQRLHFLRHEFIADTDTRVLDLGYCLLRLDTIED